MKTYKTKDELMKATGKDAIIILAEMCRESKENKELWNNNLEVITKLGKEFLDDPDFEKYEKICKIVKIHPPIDFEFGGYSFI